MPHLSLKKCTQPMCERCDMGYILKDYVKPIMQCLTNDIKDYYMKLLTTKCLNNSLMIAYFLLGKKGIDIADYCDTNAVQERHASKVDNNVVLIDKLEKQMLHKVCAYRQLYYILMTDSEFPHDDGTVRNFPGHVFIIEKIPGVGEPTYYFHQAYINQYDYAGHIKKNKGLELSYTEMKRILQQIRYVLSNPTWDAKTVKYWKEITFVDTRHMLGAQSGGKMFLCFKKAKVSECVGRLEKYARDKLKGIAKLKIDQMNEIYGNEAAYGHDQNPLTVAEMKSSLEKMLKTIESEKK